MYDIIKCTYVFFSRSSAPSGQLLLGTAVGGQRRRVVAGACFDEALEDANATHHL